MHSLVRLLAMIAMTGAAALINLQAARAVTFDCNTQSARVAQTTAAQSTTDYFNFVDLTGISVSFDAAGGSCAIVEFSAQVRAPAPNAVRIRAVLDNGSVAAPSFVDFFTPANKIDGRAVTFTLRNLPAGTRTIKIQVMSVNGSAVHVARATMVVRYAGGT
jgi:hypothetical protein